VGRHIAGLTLVELMVSAALTAILCLALATLALLGQRAYLADAAMARLQEDGRLALRVLQRELSMAGYLGWAEPVSVVVDVTGTPCYEALLGPLPAIAHYDDLAADGRSPSGAALPAACRRGAHYQTGSDALLLRRVADTPDVDRGSTLRPLADAGTYLRLAGSAQLVPGAAAGAAGASIWRYRPALLYVRDYSIRPGDGIPALCRLRLSPERFDTAPTECLLEGLEMLQVEFGVDSDGDRRADRYVPHLARGDQPVLARVSILMRSASHAGVQIDRAVTSWAHAYTPHRTGGSAYCCRQRYCCAMPVHSVVERRRSGLALVTSLVVLLALAMLAAALLDTFTVHVRLAGGNLGYLGARQAALAQLETWLDYLALAVPAGEAGDRHCPAGTVSPACQYPDLPLELLDVAATELLLIDTDRAPPRRAEVEASSAVSYRAAHYEITATARAEHGGPDVSLTQGVLVLYPGGGL
jgi:hypothetical protein